MASKVCRRLFGQVQVSEVILVGRYGHNGVRRVAKRHRVPDAGPERPKTVRDPAAGVGSVVPRGVDGDEVRTDDGDHTSTVSRRPWLAPFASGWLTVTSTIDDRADPSRPRARRWPPLSQRGSMSVLAPAVCCLHGRQRMEQFWSRAVATSGNRWQMGTPRKRRNQAKTVAVGCDQLPIGAHGKEGVDGSSPSEGSKIPGNRGFLLPGLVQPSTSLPGRGSPVAQPRPKCSNPLEQAQFGTPLASATDQAFPWGQVLGTLLILGRVISMSALPTAEKLGASALVSRLDNKLADGEPPQLLRASVSFRGIIRGDGCRGG